MPALANAAITSSQSPPSAGRIAPSSVCSRERLQRGLGHRVHGERRGERLDVQNVVRPSGPWFRCWPTAGAAAARRRCRRAASAASSATGAPPRRSACATAMPSRLRKRGRYLVRDRHVPRLTNTDATEPTLGLSPASMRRSMPRRNASAAATIVLAREQQRHVDRDAGEDRLLDGRQTLFRAGNLDEQIRPRRPRVQLFGRGECALSCRGRAAARPPATPSRQRLLVRSWIGRKRSAARVRSSSARSKNNASPDLPCLQLLADGRVVGRAVLDGVVEDRGVRREPRDRQLVDVLLERSAVEQVAGDVVEPDALAEVVEQLCRFHRVNSVVDRGAAPQRVSQPASGDRRCPLRAEADALAPIRQVGLTCQVPALNQGRIDQFILGNRLAGKRGKSRRRCLMGSDRGALRDGTAAGEPP